MSNDTFAPTHAAPPGGMQTWSTPDPAARPDNQLSGGLPVQLLEETVGWGHVRCSNGWECWVDARLLVALAPAAAPQPVAPAPTPPYETAPAAAAAAAAPQPAPTAVPVPPAPEPAPAPPVEPAPPPAPSTEFRPTHRAPDTGLATRESPDPGRRPTDRIEPGLELQVVQRADDWARVRCSNGWETWVDGRYLVAV